MDVSEFVRDLLYLDLDEEAFVIYVSELIEDQLKEWDESYEVLVLKLKNYHWIIRNEDREYHVELSEKKVQALQKKDPFALDRKIWWELEQQGIPIIKGIGNYLNYVMW